MPKFNSILEITFTGPPGCGKTYALKLVSEMFKKMGIEHTSRYEPDAIQIHTSNLMDTLSNAPRKLSRTRSR